MNKKQLVAKISSTLGQSKADAERTFDSITTIILATSCFLFIYAPFLVTF